MPYLTRLKILDVTKLNFLNLISMMEQDKNFFLVQCNSYDILPLLEGEVHQMTTLARQECESSVFDWSI